MNKFVGCEVIAIQRCITIRFQVPSEAVLADLFRIDTDDFETTRYLIEERVSDICKRVASSVAEVAVEYDGASSSSFIHD
jgi:hypothetical protein